VYEANRLSEKVLAWEKTISQCTFLLRRSRRGMTTEGYKYLEAAEIRRLDLECCPGFAIFVTKESWGAAAAPWRSLSSPTGTAWRWLTFIASPDFAGGY